jgi:phosphatidylglycerol:prolipoprotein diacylglycerol transferase
MVSFSHLETMVLSGVVRLGPFRVSSYGLCAAVGLVAALWLSQRLARKVGMMAQAVWDAGMFALGTAFVVSRVLLAVRDWHAFRMYPMVLMALPSFTYLGMGITAVVVLGYVLAKKMPLLGLLDVWAPCGALLGAALSVGHLAEGSDPGMPWGRGGALLPVQWMAAGLSGALLVMLLWLLKRRRSGQAGLVAGVGLVLGGVVAFGVEMLMQPTVSGDAWLEPGQWIAIGAMMVGAVVLIAVKEWV